MGDLLPLQLINRQRSVTEMISRYLENNNMFDVTLVCESFNEARQYEAHRVVLAANSQYFENLFRGITNPQPTFYLDVPPAQMDLILQYMYTGQVTTEFENSEQLLRTFEILMIRGFRHGTELNFGNRPAALGIWENRFTANDNRSVRISIGLFFILA